jgi:LPXTG-motif cell wall-anchored protein
MGSLRLLAAFAVLALAGLAVLFVLDVIPREQLADTANKVFALLGIALVAVLGLGALFKTRD